MYGQRLASFAYNQGHRMNERLHRQLLAALGKIDRLQGVLKEHKDSLGAVRTELRIAREDTAAARQDAAAARQDAAATRAALAAYEPADAEALQDSRRKLQRLAADLANLRRRQEEERDRARTEARAGLLREFVEILDGMERALAASMDTESAWHQGSVALRRQLEQVLTRAGVVRLGDEGEWFDPHLHEAVGTTSHSDQPPDHIAAVVQAGYRFDDGALIRPARVVVSA